MSGDSQPIGPIKANPLHGLDDLPPIILGGATFNIQYNENPENMPIEELLTYSFNHGIIALDTSPYYGPSEIIVGKGLSNIQKEHPRDSYYICTKAGRKGLDDFDYSPEWVRKSVLRSLQRLNTSYLDLVYMHDIEFVKEDAILDALVELKKLKEEGIIRHFGISGYIVKYLYKVASLAVKNEKVGALDCILSYSNMCLQNTILLEYYDKFVNECQVKKIMNASILSMSLLRSSKTHEFHPASQDLKDKCQEVAQFLQEKYNIELADLATRFAVQNWLQKGSTVIGISNLDELKAAVKNYWLVKSNIDGVNDKDAIIVKETNALFAEHLNEVWQSGIEHEY